MRFYWSQTTEPLRYGVQEHTASAARCPRVKSRPEHQQEAYKQEVTFRPNAMGELRISRFVFELQKHHITIAG